MRLKGELAVCLLIFLGIAAARIFMAFQAEGFSDDHAYAVLRQVEHISETGRLIGYDELSYGGRERVTAPLFPYLLAAFNLFLPLELVAKIVPNLLAAALSIIMFYLAKQISGSLKIMALSAIVVGSIPIFVAKTVNAVSVYTLVLPLIFFMIYCLLRMEQRRFIGYFMIAAFALALTSPAGFVVVLGLIFYLILVRLEKLDLTRQETELILFIVVLMAATEFIIYRKALALHSYAVIWQNVPFALLAEYFPGINLLQAIYQIGIIPFLGGVYIIHRRLASKKGKFAYLMMSFALAVGMLLWFSLIQLEAGLLLLGSILAALCIEFFSAFMRYLERTKVDAYKDWVLAGLGIIVIITSGMPALAFAGEELEQAPSRGEIAALEFLGTQPQGVVLATVREGNRIASIARKKNVIDDDFLLVRDSRDRIQDTRFVFTTFSETGALELLQKYDVKYIYISPRAKERYGIMKLAYLNEECFEKIYDAEVQIYRVRCTLE
ncbi:hypothetical protein HY491_03250 [Candidatus Woesearchaeota archaeon]|nr:hypothetical protein [Candidatus Woesearchaeota archaeon]